MNENLDEYWPGGVPECSFCRLGSDPPQTLPWKKSYCKYLVKSHFDYDLRRAHFLHTYIFYTSNFSHSRMLEEVLREKDIYLNDEKEIDK